MLMKNYNRFSENSGIPAFRGEKVNQFSHGAHPVTVFSGADVSVWGIYGSNIQQLGNAHTLSYSVHREKFPVRRLGQVYPSGYTRGSRTLAGSMVFINFQSAALSKLFSVVQQDPSSDPNALNTTFQNPYMLSDQLPPFDLLLFFRNENGRMSFMRILGVEIADEGGVLGIDEQYTETTMQYLARDISLLRPINNDNLIMEDGSANITFLNNLKLAFSQQLEIWNEHNESVDGLPNQKK